MFVLDSKLEKAIRNLRKQVIVRTARRKGLVVSVKNIEKVGLERPMENILEQALMTAKPARSFGMRQITSVSSSIAANPRKRPAQKHDDTSQAGKRDPRRRGLAIGVRDVTIGHASRFKVVLTVVLIVTVLAIAYFIAAHFQLWDLLTGLNSTRNSSH